MTFLAKFWGTRGSVPSPGPSTVRYGGNTSCVEVRCGDTVIVLDAGTGIRPLGLDLVQRRIRKIWLLLSHTHMDHVQGFPFFKPLYTPGVDIRICSPAEWARSAEEVLRRQMESYYFPVGLDQVPAQVSFEPQNKSFWIEDVSIQRHPLNHPGGSFAYRLEYAGRVLVYLADHEPYCRQFGGSNGNQALDAGVSRFAHGANLLIREAQYTAEEYQTRRGWGHATMADALESALRSGAKQIALFHHDPEHDDVFLEREFCVVKQQHSPPDGRVFLASEGQEISVD